MNFEIVDWKFIWERNEIILCCMFTDTRKHFYITHKIETVEEADEIISHWEISTTMFFDPEHQHPN